MKRHALLFALLLAGATQAAEPQMYVRGAFNGWGTDNPLVAKGQGKYEADILVSPGYHAFKVGTGDWSEEWIADASASVAIQPGRDYKLDKHAGPEDYLFTKQAATYRFTLDLTAPAAPTLRVRQLALAQADTRDPHSGSDTVTLDVATWDGKRAQARFSAQQNAAGLRTYVHSTTEQLRDPGPRYRSYSEAAGLPTIRSGNLAFDALFALAVTEMKQDSVSEIRDGNYNAGAAIPCECFETGEKWHYVWTRDLSYAAHLGLALLDPHRVKNSLEFKLSGYRDGVRRPARAKGSDDGLQIVQDTGSGGSWPVSTDRVAWAFAAEEVLKTLPAAERKAFAARALKALSNTLENDRLAAFDRSTGLYTGEQSFLDWRDQSYAAWIPGDLASMASASALSTNVAHYKALTLAAQLAREHGDGARAGRYAGWARDLKAAVNRRLWLPGEGMYSSLTAGHFDGAPLHKFDWLGQSLAIVTGIASPAQAERILASYPHGPMGAPVIWPQQHGIPVYHNRAVWPFVTAYGLKAAAVRGNVAVADAAYDSLIRGAALSLSNMENLEWLTGQPILLDERNPALGGPVINSRRQLWSVGGYLGMVVGEVFGVSVNADGLALQPFVTARLRRMFGASDTATLDNLRIHGKRVSVRLRLPPASDAEGFYRVASITLNGKQSGARLPFASLRDENLIEMTLGGLEPGQQQIRRVNADPYAEPPSVFGPREPQLNDDAARLYRNGRPVSGAFKADGACWSAEAVYADSGNRSHHSEPLCTGDAVTAGIDNKITVTQPGRYAVQLKYRNAANQVNLGVTAGVKWLSVKDAAGRIVAQG
ncbi:MAG TPA: esterase, partial [Telluria sp.]|nr:esterase [Telluria sp.]